MRADKIRRTFETLLASNDATGRGRAFEKILYAKLSADGYDVRLNPKAAKPRQTDLIASLNGQDYLIEAKWRRKKVDVADVGSLRDRLRRTPADFVGCIFNMSDFTAEAIAEVEADRTREILLFNASEINSIISGRVAVQDLIRKKRDALRFGAKVQFLNASGGSDAFTLQFPTASQQVTVNEQPVSYVSFPTDGEDIGFFLDIPDICAFNTSARLELRLDVQTLTELAELLQLLERTVGLSSRGCFSIHQRSHCWHGFGVAAFLGAAREWKKRYADANLQAPHHSEELAYFDLSDGVLIAVTASQRVGDSSFLHGSELELQLAGVPVDMTAISELCRRTNNSGALIRTVTDEGLHSVHLGRERIKIKPIAKILTIHDSKEWVTGVVAKNPFTASRMRRLPSKFDEFFLRHLSEPKFLVCDMDHHYLNRDEVTQPFISQMYAVWAGHTPLLNVHCSWDDFIRRTPEEKKDLEALLREIPDVVGDED